MSPFRTILFAADLSESSREAFRLARALTRKDKTRLVIVNVVEQLLFEPSEPRRGDEGDPGLPAFWPSDTPEHRKVVEEQLRAFYAPAAGIEPEYLVRDGEAAEEVLRLAEEIDADLIVMETHGRSGLDRLLVGSVAEAVLRRSRCPVLALRASSQARAVEEIQRILHPTDFSERSEAALRVARALAVDLGARLVLLHVAPEEVRAGTAFFAPPDREDETNALEALQARIAGPDLKQPVEVVMAHGEPAPEIIRLAEEVESDLIVLGAHGRTGLARLVMGSTAEVIMRGAPCPTLVVKASHESTLTPPASAPGEAAPNV